MVAVVCGIISNHGKVLICRRKKEKSMGGFWEFPGGKIEDSESPNQTLVRELYEELGMKVKVQDHFTTVTHQYDDFTIKLIAIKCDLVSATYEMTDHDAYEWVRVKELLKWNLAAADIPIANALVVQNQV